MLVFTTLSLLSLVLVASLFYPIFAQSCLSDRKLDSGLAMGCIFSAGAALMLVGGFRLDGGLIVSGIAGVLIFAGYLGGAVTAVVTLALTLALRSWFGGAILPVSAAMLTALVLAGYLLRGPVAFTDWPRLPAGALRWALSAYLVVETGFLLAAYLSGLLPPEPGPALAARYAAGSLSVTLAWLLLKVSWHQSALQRANDTLLRQLHLVFETCGIGVFRYNGRTGKLSFESNFLKLYRASANAWITPSNFAETQVHPDDREEMRAYILSATHGSGTEGNHIFRALGVEGTYRHMRSSWKLEDTNSDGSRNIIGLHMDLSDVMAAQQRQAEAERQVAAIAENLPGVIFQIIWKDGAPTQTTYVSPKATRIWGKSQAELLADPYATASQYEEGELERALGAISQSVATGEPQSLRVRLRNLENEPMVVDLHILSSPIDGDAHVVNGFYLDVTREAAAEALALRNEELARQAQKTESIGRLTGGIAHDFNNHLAVILGNLELVREDPDPAAKAAMIDTAIGACNRGAELTRSMLSFARRAELSPAVLDLNAIVRDAGNWIGRTLPSSIALQTSLLDGLWKVEIDKVSLESALLNLIVNARDAMQGSGKLTIETANLRIDHDYVDSRLERLAPGRYVMLAVSDTGEGMDAHTLERIFEPFFTTKAPGAGSGIGLAMVLGFVRQSGGTVQVYSEPGLGTTFKLYFPAASDDAQQKPVASTGDPPALPAGEADRPTRVLLAEDEDGVRKVVRITLENAGYRVTDAPSGDAALALFQRDPAFDVVVTDMVMPGALQGPNLADAIRRLAPDMRFVFMTGYASEAMLQRSDLHPEAIRLTKPFPKADLLAAVREALASGERLGGDDPRP